MQFLNCAVCGFFVMDRGLVGFERMAQLVNAVTGWNTSVFELMKVGERAVTLARAFNRREGFTSDDDDMPRRFFTPHISGPLQGVALDREAFREAKELYYDMMGWPQGSPSLGKLGELGIEWVMPLIQPE
jgi:aldehyde:ferredoxin oxidoreductase